MVVQTNTAAMLNSHRHHALGLTKSAAGRPARRGYSLRDTERVGARLWMRTPTFAVGLGSAGVRVVFGLAEHIIREAGYLPDVFAYLGADADADLPPRHYGHSLAFGVDGAGTDPTIGREMFLKKLADIWNVFKSHFRPLLEGDPRFPTERTARQTTTVHVVAGSGGTSGGAEQPLIDLLHAVSQVYSIQELRIHLHHIGPDVPLADTGRTTSREQFEIVQSTFAANVWRLLTDYALDEYRTVVRYDGRPLSLPCRLRVTSHSLTSRTNGEVDCLVSGDTEEKLSWTLFQRVMTASGIDHDARTCDERGYGAPYGFAR